MLKKQTLTHSAKLRIHAQGWFYSHAFRQRRRSARARICIGVVVAFQIRALEQRRSLNASYSRGAVEARAARALLRPLCVLVSRRWDVPLGTVVYKMNHIDTGRVIDEVRIRRCLWDPALTCTVIRRNCWLIGENIYKIYNYFLVNQRKMLRVRLSVTL